MFSWFFRTLECGVCSSLPFPLNFLDSGAEFRPCPISFVVASLVLTPASLAVPSAVPLFVINPTAVVVVSANEPPLSFGQ